jgi:hypothetical protein
MIAVRDTESLSSVTRVAAHAALMLLDKYFSLTDECEIYPISIGTVSYFFSNYSLSHISTVMSPDKKLRWFEQHNYTPEAVARVRRLVIARWEESYRSATSSNPTNIREAPVTHASEPNKVCLLLLPIIPVCLSYAEYDLTASITLPSLCINLRRSSPSRRHLNVPR